MMAPRTDGQAARPIAGPDPDDTLSPGLTVAPTQPRRGLVLVRVFGEIDMLTVRHLHDVLDASLRAVADERDLGQDSTLAGGTPTVVCDLEGVTFLGASGLDAFAAAHETAVERGVHLVLVAAHRTVVRPLRLTALDRRLELTATHPALGRRVPAGQGAR